jgi:hypothetical protein
MWRYHRISLLICILTIVSAAHLASANNVPVQGRVFIGSTVVDPVNVNAELNAQGLKEVDSMPQFGAEILYPVLKYVDVGLRYTKRNISRDELISVSSTEFESQIDQDSALAVVRVPFFKTDIVRIDVFAGFGGTNTSYKIKTATQDGELTRKDTNAWFASSYSSYGGSVAIGYKQFYFVVEGGIESNEVKGFKSTGTINSLNTIDLSGSYFTVGLMFDGITASSK